MDVRVRHFLVILLIFIGIFSPPLTLAWVRGIYVTQPTLESTKTITYLIKNAKELGIDTFVIDFYTMRKQYRQNIALVKQNHIRYVARIVMFPYGALTEQVQSQAYLQKRYHQIMQAASLGADEIQLDYIRYRKSRRASEQNAKDIYQVIKQVKELLNGKGIKLQIDIFGVASGKPSVHIGQNVQLFAPLLNAICPMVYPSHYEPFRYHATRPYQTVYDSVIALRRQLKDFPDVKIYAYIELYNYRYPLSRPAKVNYILEEMKAVRDAQADGWYAWSAKNKYAILFSILRSRMK